MSRVWKYRYPLFVLGTLIGMFSYLAFAGKIEITSSVPSESLNDEDFSIEIDHHYWGNSQQTFIFERGTWGNSPSLVLKDVLVVDLTVTNRAKNHVGLHCQVRDAQGQIYLPIITSDIGITDDLISIVVEPKEVRGGKLGFLAPKSEQSLWLHCGKNLEVKIQ